MNPENNTGKFRHVSVRSALVILLMLVMSFLLAGCIDPDINDPDWQARDMSGNHNLPPTSPPPPRQWW